MTSKLYLAIDQGGQSSRVAIYTEQGELLHVFTALCATYQYSVDDYPVDFIEQDGDDILAGIKSCLQQLQIALGDKVHNLVAAGFAGQGSSLLCWDRLSGKALSPVLSWQDIRGEAELKTIPLTHQDAQKITGLRVSPHYGASKISWCLQHNPSVKKALQEGRLCVGPIVSFLFRHLLDNSESNIVDPGHAQRTLLWNLHTNNWDKTLLDLFSIPLNILPRCLYHDSFFGSLQLGNHKVPFMASARDQGASLFARGMPDKNVCYINIGTGAFIQRVSQQLSVPDGLLVSPLFIPTENHPAVLYAWEATVNGAASALTFMQEQVGYSLTPEAIELASKIETSGYFLNAIGGLSAPYWRTDLQSEFSEGLTADEKICAWLNSIIFQIVVNVSLMNTLGAAQKIIISGGLSRVDMLCQHLADLTATPVHRSENSDATLQGIAYMAAAMSSEWQCVEGEEIFLPKTNLLLQETFKKWEIAMNTWLA